MIITVKKIWVDMYGPHADLYSDPDWLAKLQAYDPTPYANAKPLLDMVVLSAILNRLQQRGYQICIVSWLSKEPTPTYDQLVIEAKKQWLKKYLGSVVFDQIDIIPHGTPKAEGREGILFEDEPQYREAWGEGAFGRGSLGWRGAFGVRL